MYGDRGSTAPALGMNSDFSRTLKTQMVRVVIIIVMLMVVIVWLVGWLVAVVAIELYLEYSIVFCCGVCYDRDGSHGYW
jgi:hypothetical protein